MGPQGGSPQQAEAVWALALPAAEMGRRTPTPLSDLGPDLRSLVVWRHLNPGFTFTC